MLEQLRSAVDPETQQPFKARNSAENNARYNARVPISLNSLLAGCRAGSLAPPYTCMHEHIYCSQVRVSKTL